MLIVNLKESGKIIAEKLLLHLTASQKSELIEFIADQAYMESGAYVSIKDSLKKTSRLLFMRENDITEIQIQELYVCLEHRSVCVKGEKVQLTVKEFDLLALMIMHPKRVFTYEMIMDLVWHEDYTFYSRKAVNNHVSNLRKKIKITPDTPDYIKSVYGIGYKFDV